MITWGRSKAAAAGAKEEEKIDRIPVGIAAIGARAGPAESAGGKGKAEVEGG